MNAESKHRGGPDDPIGSARKAQLQQPTEERDISENGNTALLVKRCYETERSGWESRKEGRTVVYCAPARYDGDPQPTVKGERKASLLGGRKSQWLALATWCAERQIEPTAFIRVVFEQVPLDRKLAPEPTQLRSEKYFGTWSRHEGRLLETMATTLGIEKRAASAAIASYQIVGTNPNDSYAIVLMNRHVNLSPLMRYCLATSIGGMRFRRIARRFEPEAILQFMRYQSQYKQVWKDVLPEGFADRAKRIYSHLINELRKGNEAVR